MKSKPSPSLTDYEITKRDAFSDNAVVREKVAQRLDVTPEILYHLATDQNACIRQAVAGNRNAPIHALELLADDHSDVVRTAVALQIIDIVDYEETAGATTLADGIVRVLDKLARDPLDTVRTMLAEAFKASWLVPKAIIMHLARDPVAAVACPILQWSPQIIDAEFVDLLDAHPCTQARAAVASRGASKNALTEPVLISDRDFRRAVEMGERQAVIAALAAHSQTSVAIIQHLLRHRQTKGLLAACWATGLSASTCYFLQLKLAHLRGIDAIAPRNGDYALERTELNWHLELLRSMRLDTAD